MFIQTFFIFSSKIPIPKFLRRVVTRGVKRDLSPSAPSSAVKRSPTASHRKVFSELPIEQRKIVKSMFVQGFFKKIQE